MTSETALKRTPLYEAHRRLGARLVPFAGWAMPVEYTGVVEEHLAVRERAGLFDVSHMGELFVEGPDALALLEHLTPNHVGRLEAGQAQYTALTNERGGFVDDLLVYRLGEESFLAVVNAANTEKDRRWIEGHGRGRRVAVRDRTDELALLALQGPKAEAILAPLAEGVELAALRYYRFVDAAVAGVPATIARTGYTGEDGFELLVDAAGAETVWTRLLEAGAPSGLVPVGLGARDTLRLEAKMALYGNDIDEDHTVLEADLGWIVKWEKGEFIGRAALERQRDEGLRRRLAGWELVDRGIARHGYPVFYQDRPCEPVASGSFAPYLKKAIGLSYLPVEATAIGTEIEIEIRGRRARARVVPTPFYRRPRRRPASGGASAAPAN